MGGAPTATKAQVLDISNTDIPTGRVCPDLPEIPGLGTFKGGFLNGRIMIGDRADCLIYMPENNTWSTIPVDCRVFRIMRTVLLGHPLRHFQ